MRTKLLIGWAIVLSVLVSVAAMAQEQRTIPVTVIAKDGKVVEGLTAANFRATFRGKPVEMVSATRDDSPHQIMIFLDVSPSMAIDGNWPRAKAVLLELLQVLPDEYQVGLVLFDEESRVFVPHSAGRAALLTTASGISMQERNVAFGDLRGGETKLPDALIEYGQQTGMGEGTLIIVSDGYYLENAGRLSRGRPDLNKARSRMIDRRNRFFCLLVGKAIGMQNAVAWRGGVHNPKINPKALEGSAEDTGGIFLLPYKGHSYRSFRDPSETAAEIGAFLQATTRLAIELPASIVKRRKLRLQVVDESGKKMKGVKVHYPRYLVPLEGPQPE